MNNDAAVNGSDINSDINTFAIRLMLLLSEIMIVYEKRQFKAMYKRSPFDN